MEQVKQVDSKTLRDYRGVVENKLGPEFGDKPLDAITPDDVDSWKEELLAEGKVSNRTIVRYLTVMHGVFKRAKRVYGLKQNPASAELVERPRVVYTGEFTTYDRAELELLVNAAEDAQTAGAVQGRRVCGAASGGAARVAVGARRLRRRPAARAAQLHDGAEKVPKGKRVRSVPMTPDVVDALANLNERGYLAEDGDLVFCSATGAHLDHFTVRRHFHSAIKRAELRRIRFHDLRHHFGSMAITVLDGYAVQSYTGHQHYTTTQRYLHHKPRKEDAAKLGAAFAESEAPATHQREPGRLLDSAR